MQLTCGGTTLDVVVNGRGFFTPAHDQGSTAVLVPIEFGEVIGTVFDADGNEVSSFVDDAIVTKGNAEAAAAGREVQACTYVSHETFVATEEDAVAGLTPG